MTFAAPLGLLALLSVPIIIGIHLFRRRFPERQVAGLFLWHSGREVAHGGGRLDRLPITWSLLLELLAAIALSLILAGARLTSAAEVPHLVVLLDDSASMSAAGADGTSVRDRAITRIRREVDGLGRAGRVTFVRSGERPVVLSGPSALPAEALAALEGWQPRARHHAFALGLRLARELAGPAGRLLIVSDTTAERRNGGEVANATWVALGESRPNVGIIAATRTPASADGGGSLVLTLGNYSDVPQARQLTLRAGDTTVSTANVTAAPGVSVVRVPVPAGVPVARATLSADALLRDNEVLLAEPQARSVIVDNRLPDGRGREAMTRALAAIADVVTGAGAHLQIVEPDALGRAGDPGVWRAVFGPAPPALQGSGASEDYIGPYVLEKRHPLLLGVSLGGVVWTGALPLAPDVRPVASAGDRGLVADVTPPGGTMTVLFNLDLERSNLIRTPDWPILVSNLVEMRRQQLPGPERWNYRAGEWIRVRLGRDPEGPLRVRSEAGERTLPASRQIELVAPETTGPLEILDGDRTLFTLGINFLDETESDLRVQVAVEPGAYPATTAGSRSERGIADDPLFWALLLIAGAAMIANWRLPRAERRIA